MSRTEAPIAHRSDAKRPKKHGVRPGDGLGNCFRRCGYIRPPASARGCAPRLFLAVLLDEGLQRRLGMTADERHGRLQSGHGARLLMWGRRDAWRPRRGGEPHGSGALRLSLWCSAPFFDMSSLHLDAITRRGRSSRCSWAWLLLGKYTQAFEDQSNFLGLNFFSQSTWGSSRDHSLLTRLDMALTWTLFRPSLGRGACHIAIPLIFLWIAGIAARCLEAAT